MITFNHYNVNVLNLERSIRFYNEALGLTVQSEKVAEDGSFRLVFLTDGITSFRMELTWLKDRTQPYNLGDEEFHLAFHVDDYEALHEKHEKMGCIAFENPSMGIYFITDPDGYWIEIVPAK